VDILRAFDFLHIPLLLYWGLPNIRVAVAVALLRAFDYLPFLPKRVSSKMTVLLLFPY
jgi:hypothetical protein